MRTCLKVSVALMLPLFVPTALYAQASIAGTVKDSSGGVLPGVSVEAASPALIEKVRTTVSDANGQYQIVDLRPGVYTVTFELQGFNTFRRDGIVLSGSFTASVDAEMRVGALEETITVSGEAPIVDVQSATRQQVLNHEVIDALPTGRAYSSLATLIPGVNSSQATVGGIVGDQQQNLTVHGSRNADMRIQTNGITNGSLQSSGSVSLSTPNVSAAQEVTIDTAAGSAEAPTGGVRINLIPRDGGNDLRGFTFVSFATAAMQGDNLTERLFDQGYGTPESLAKVWDVNFGIGGPFRRDRVWFFLSGRYNGQSNNVGGMFVNRNANDPNAWTYEPDESRPAQNKARWLDAQLRTTWQATARNKIAITYNQQHRKSDGFYASATRAPEAGNDRDSPHQRWLLGEWTSPLTDRLLFEAVASYRSYAWGNYPPVGGGWASATPPGLISVTEQSTGLIYRSGQGGTAIGPGVFSESSVPNYQYRASVSYITGTHAVKVGVGDLFGYLDQTFLQFPTIAYRFNNGVPNQVTMYALPFTARNNLDHDFNLYAQDKWTIDRLTLTYGLRYDWIKGGVPEQHIGPAELVPTRNFVLPADDYLNWKDLSPRTAAVYDVFGTGKTAIKASLNRYLNGQGLAGLGGFPTNPAANIVNSTTRTWTDIDRDYVVDCDLVNPVANGECQAMANPDFGKQVPGATFDPELLTGWGNRNYNWEFSAGVQHEVLPRVGLDVAYFRRWFGNFEVIDNTALAPSDYDPFAITLPTSDSRLPGAGSQLGGFFALKQDKFGVPVANLHTLSDKYGKQIERWNGVDVSVNARLNDRILLQGGVSTGKTVTDNCEVVAQLPELLFGGQALATANANSWISQAYCHQESPFLTQVKLFGVYTVPWLDMQVSGTLQSLPGPMILSNYNAPNAVVAPILGRPLAGGAPNITLQLVDPGGLYGERLNQVDLRFAKVFRLANRRRATINVDLYNALNADTVLTVNNAFAAWQRPTLNINARFITIGGQIDF